MRGLAGVVDRLDGADLEIEVQNARLAGLAVYGNPLRVNLAALAPTGAQPGAEDGTVGGETESVGVEERESADDPLDESDD